MQVKMFNPDCYESWEEAEKFGAIYSVDVPPGIDVRMAGNHTLISRLIDKTAECISADTIIAWKLEE